MPVPVPLLGAGKTSGVLQAISPGLSGPRRIDLLSIQDTVHDILEEGFQAGHCELEAGIPRSGEYVEKDTCQ